MMFVLTLTAQFLRYHTPKVLNLQDQVHQYRDELKLAAKTAWGRFLSQVDSVVHGPMRIGLLALGAIDVLISFAQLASQPGYIQPSYATSGASDQQLSLRGARHPTVEHFLEKNGGAFVPNDVLLRCDFGERSCQVITGPNMGGKSSYVRMIALLCIMGQIGCHVPAEEAQMTVFDNIYTRMGNQIKIA